MRGYSAAGLAGIMIEDQVSPKKCGHTKGKDVVGFSDAVARVRAAVLAREKLMAEQNPAYDGAYSGETQHLLGDIVIIARTDARGPLGMEEAVRRLQAFRQIDGFRPTDMTFLEAPETIEEMERYCSEVPGPKLANCLEEGLTPILPPATLASLGFTVAAYPLSLLAASIAAMDTQRP